MEIKTEIINGGTPLPQRAPKNQQNANKNPASIAGSKNNQMQNQQKPQVDSGDGAPVEKKPRFGGQQQGGGQNQAQKGFPGNKNQGGNRGRGGGNQNRGGNRGNFQNPNQNQQNDTVKIQANADLNNSVDLQNDSNQNRGGNRPGGAGGGGSIGGGGGGGGGNRDRNRNRGGQGGSLGGGNMFPGGRGDDFFIGQRLRAISGPTHELPPIELPSEPKFSGRNRLYIGNLTSDVNEDELREMFKPYGEIGEIFANPEKNFAFLKVDYHANAEKAKRELDGSQRKGRNLRVRFAPNATIVRVKNLTQFVSNELLYRCFEIFGPIERATILVDDRGKPTGEGIVEFAKKASSNACMRLCSEKCFFLTAALRPCVVEPFEANDDMDGLPEKSINKKTPEFHHERGAGPRFAEIDSFEHEYGTRWKQLYELYKTKQEALKRELRMEEEKLEAQMEYARYEHETELLRQELRKRESDNERKKLEWEMREKQAEEMKKREEENMRRQQNEMQSRMLRQEEEMRRRQQENTLFMQAQQLNSLLDQQEGTQGPGGFAPSGNTSNFDPFGAGGGNSPFDFRGVGGNNNAVGGNSGPNTQQRRFKPVKKLKDVRNKG